MFSPLVRPAGRKKMHPNFTDTKMSVSNHLRLVVTKDFHTQGQSKCYWVKEWTYNCINLQSSHTGEWKHFKNWLYVDQGTSYNPVKSTKGHKWSFLSHSSVLIIEQYVVFRTGASPRDTLRMLTFRLLNIHSVGRERWMTSLSLLVWKCWLVLKRSWQAGRHNEIK